METKYIKSLLTLGCMALSLTVAQQSMAVCSSAGEPTDNPVATKYGSTTYPWTGNIKWTCIFNINNYSGATTDAKFNAARDAAVANAGGVVYFPAGTWNFTDSIYLKNGVVIRGANPATSDAKSSSYAPGSKLVFPKYNQSLSGSGTANTTAFKYISTTTVNTDSNIGVVNVDLNRGAIKILATDAATQNNNNILVFGVRQNNIGEADAGVPTTWQNAWQRWCYRFSANVKIMGKSNILVANNRINDAITDSYDQPNYKVKNGTTVVTLTVGSYAKFNYANHYGLDINRGKPGGYALAATPATEPTLFRTGVVIRDNYVYHTMRIAITAAGDGLIVKDNMVRDLAGKVAWVDPTGKTLVGNSATLENRAVDWSGYNVSVTGNDYQVERHQLKDTIYNSVDGEGILLQECCGGSMVSGVTISGNKGPKPTYIGLYKVRDVNNALITGNTVVDTGLGVYVNANTNGASYKLQNADVTNNNVDGPITMTGDITGTGGNSCTGNTDPNGGGTISHSCEASVSISSNTGFTVNACQ